MNRFRKLATILIACSVLAGGVWIAVRAALWVWARFQAVEPALSLGILSAVTTVFVATFTIMLGRYYEPKKDIEAAHRQKKVEIHDEFLQEFFQIFYEPEQAQQAGDRRNIILWGGQEVLQGYVEWTRKLKSGQMDVLGVQDGGSASRHQSGSWPRQLEAAEGYVHSLPSPRCRSVSRSVGVVELDIKALDIKAAG